MDLAVTAEDGSCENGPVYRVAAVNTGSTDVEGMLVLGPFTPELPSGDLRVLCPTEPGQCEFRIIPSDSPTPLQACLFNLSAGDDFACRVTFKSDTISLRLSDKAGSVSATAQTATDLLASCEAPPAIQFSAVCGGDPTYRFGIVNTGSSKLTNLRLLTDSPSPEGSQVLLCPTDPGVCDPRLVPTGSGTTDAFPECDFELSPGDDFACRVNLPVGSLNVFLFGQTFSGLPLFDASEVSCSGSAP